MKNENVSAAVVAAATLFALAATVGPVTSVKAGPPTLSANPAHHVIFPAKGQTSEQQEKDEHDAYDWACEQTGWDPYKAHDALMEQSKETQEAAGKTRGAAFGGAARGALLGLAVGAIAGESGEGAAIGAAAGGLGKGMRSQKSRSQLQTSQAGSEKEYKAKFAEWDKHFVAAMKGKGYTIE